MNKRNYTIFFLLIFLTASSFAYSQDYWLKSTLPNANMNLNKVTSADSLKFYIAADSGKIFYSSNAGVNWISQNTGIPNNIIDIRFYRCQIPDMQLHGNTVQLIQIFSVQ
jgi:hypothetical protein